MESPSETIQTSLNNQPPSNKNTPARDPKQCKNTYISKPAFYYTTVRLAPSVNNTPIWGKKSSRILPRKKQNLVGGFNPPEKY